MIRRPKFIFGGSTYEALVSSPSWLPKDSTVGGRRISAAGIPATYIVRRDALLDLTLRFHEEDWPSILSLIQFGQTGQLFEWYPDADLGDVFGVYLEDPAPGTQFNPARDSSYPRVLQLTITLRGADTVPWFEYFSNV